MLQQLIRSYSFSSLFIVACTLVPISPVVAQDGAGYVHFTLSIVARTGDSIAGHTLSYLGSPAINNKGLVVFTARFSDIPPPECLGVTATELCMSAVLTPTLVLKKTGDAIEREILTWIIDPVSLNDSGTVAFAAGTKSLDTGAMLGQRAVFTQDRLIAKPGKEIDGCTISQIGASDRVLLDPRPAIDQLGNVFFSADYLNACKGGGVGSNIFTEHHIVHVRHIPAGFFSVSGSGRIAALTSLGVYDRNSAIVNYGVPIQGKRLDAIGPPAVNDAGEVVYAGQFACSPNGCSDYVATRSRLIARAGDLIGGVRVSEFRTPVINNRGVIVFRALTDSAGFLLFSTELGLIAKPGDVIGGKTVQTVGRQSMGGYVSMNNEGRVVFLAMFTDGSQAIVLATPTPRRR